MTVVARHFVATPARPASETWAAIVALVSKDSSAGRRELESVSGVAANLIADEAPKNAPMVVAGNGPRLRIYCLYDEEAILAEDKNEDALSWNPTEGSWGMRLPCPGEDLESVQAALRKRSARVSAYDPEAGDKEENEGGSTKASLPPDLSLNAEAFRKP